MIFAIEKSMQSTVWLTTISKAEALGKDDCLLQLELAGGHGRYTSLLLDEDAIVRHLIRAVGMFNNPSEIVGKSVLVVLDQLGNVVALYNPTEDDKQDDALYPPPPVVQMYPSKDGRVFSTVGVGPTFVP